MTIDTVVLQQQVDSFYKHDISGAVVVSVIMGLVFIWIMGKLA